MNRDDLRVWQINSANAAGGSGWWREVSDAELAEMDYVKVDEPQMVDVSTEDSTKYVPGDVNKRLVNLAGIVDRCLTHASEFYDEALCSAQMARLYHETGGNNLSGLAWVNEQYGECDWLADPDKGDTDG